MFNIALNNCPNCKSSDIYVSHAKNGWEKIAALALLRPVRCHGCMRRFFRPLFVVTSLPRGRILEWKKPFRRVRTAIGSECIPKIRGKA